VGLEAIAKQLEERAFKHQPRVAPRSPPCSFFYNCILQGAIVFAELPILARQGVAGFAPKPNF